MLKLDSDKIDDYIKSGDIYEACGLNIYYLYIDDLHIVEFEYSICRSISMDNTRDFYVRRLYNIYDAK
jgi:hypothetical protein